MLGLMKHLKILQVIRNMELQQRVNLIIERRKHIVERKYGSKKTFLAGKSVITTHNATMETVHMIKIEVLIYQPSTAKQEN